MNIQLTIGAMLLTVILLFGGNVWWLNKQLNKAEEQLLIEKTNNVTLQQEVKDTKKQVEEATRLLKEANEELLESRNEAAKAKQVLEDTDRLAKLAAAKSGLVTNLAINATERVFNSFEDISQEANNLVPHSTTD